MSGEHPTEEQVVDLAIRTALGAMRVQIPARVLSYNSTLQKAVIQPVIRFSRLNEDEERETYVPEPIPGVPVAFLSAGGCSITFPIPVGTLGMAHFSDRAMDEYLATGNTDNAPNDPRRFDVQDAIFVPWVHPFSDPIPAAGLDAVAMVVRGAEIRLGSSAATSYVALATLVLAQLQALATAFTTWVPVAGDGGAALKLLLTGLIATPWPASVAATKVKAE